jgi:predicted Fe-S protein YdhL (DUF1289 family)
MTDADGLAVQETVGRWLRAYDAQWNVRQTDGETRAKLEVLARFCAACGRQPDELVAWLFRPTPEGPRIRLKRRREVMALIDQFEAEGGGRAAGNTVRSFLIHNGVALSATPLR